MKHLPLVVVGFTAFGLACGGLFDKSEPAPPPEPPPPAAAPPPPPPPPVAPAAPEPAPPPALVTFEQAAFPCCSARRAHRILNEYLDLQSALAADDLVRARAEAVAVRGTALAAAKDGSLSSESRTLAQQVANIAEQAKSGDLAQIRARFGDLSEKVIALAQANEGGTDRVAVAFSPKANAAWLQKEATVSNPYLGKADATEGTFRE
ncbi:MAG: DUF3347 domain-containing protein [Deltaproteobacteria bacterium]|nr:DUF3347 domain-containing protein [Deltaproteobacteria bacterium]